MHPTHTVSRLVDLLDPRANILFNTTAEQARALVGRGDTAAIRGIDGQFALVARDGDAARMARTIGRLMRYFIAKRNSGPVLVVADRIDAIHRWLQNEALADQFHPSYTRMVPAHHLVEIRLLGCPDPNPTYLRFFDPPRGTLPPDVDEIGDIYVRALYDEIRKWLQFIPGHEPIGVCFSGGIDSGAVFLLTYHAMLNLGMNPARLKAFVLTVDGAGHDAEQARDFLQRLGLGLFLEEINTTAADLDPTRAVRVLEDYKPLDVQSGAMLLALCRGIRDRYPEWRFLLDGDGGDENLKDYPIEENPELTIRSVLNNSMLYQEGWGVDSIKHSLTYSGGHSRAYARTYAPTATLSFSAFSPYTSPAVIAVAEGIPFIELTDWRHDRLYALKGQIVARGIRAVTGLDMPVFPKRRFQHGAVGRPANSRLFTTPPGELRKSFHALYQ
ncbi:MAG: asparagine synthetase B family protein [Phycisphaerales bacterium]|nr:asparagine synthetase B family protein [Phycisphaerales bacterium]